MGVIAKFLGGLFSGVFAKLMELWLAYRAGKEAQHSADVEAAQQQDQEARKTDDEIDNLDMDELARRERERRMH